MLWWAKTNLRHLTRKLSSTVEPIATYVHTQLNTPDYYCLTHFTIYPIALHRQYKNIIHVFIWHKPLSSLGSKKASRQSWRFVSGPENISLTWDMRLMTVHNPRLKVPPPPPSLFPPPPPPETGPSSAVSLSGSCRHLAISFRPGAQRTEREEEEHDNCKQNRISWNVEHANLATFA